MLTASGQPRATGDYFVEAEAHLKALNPATGLELTRIELPANATGAPLSYLANGRQYIAVPVGGDLPSELVVLALPQADEDLPPQARSGYGADHPVFDRAVEALRVVRVHRLDDRRHRVTAARDIFAKSLLP